MKKYEIGRVLAEIIETYDESVLLDVNRVNALLMDLAPESDKERKLIVMCLREGALTGLYTARNHPMPDVVIKRCIKQLVAELWITENAARYAVETIAGAIGVEFGHTIHMDSENDHGENRSIILKGDKKASGNLELERALHDTAIVGYKAFASNNGITNVSFPDSIRKVMPKAFAYCHNISVVEIGSKIEALSPSVFDGCENIIEIRSGSSRYVCRNGILLDKAEKRTVKSENKENIDKIKIPAGIQIITDKTFEGNRAEEVLIPDTVSEIGRHAFAGMNHLRNITVDSHNKHYRSIDGVLHDETAKEVIKYPMGRAESSYYMEDSVKIIGRNCFSFAQNLKTITFTGALERIGCAAFQFCQNLETLILPYGVSVIGERAFQYCTGLKSVMLSRKIVEIDDCAFYQCTSLESVSVPEHVERIGNYAFWGCGGLKTVTIQSRVREIGYGAFEGCKTVCLKIRNNTYVENYCRAHNIEYEVL